MFVGVHARRKDYKHHLKVMISGKLVTKKYFEDAMNYFKKKYRDDHVLFIMVSDDANWMKTMFSASQFEVAFSSTAHGYCQELTNCHRYPEAGFFVLRPNQKLQLLENYRIRSLGRSFGFCRSFCI